MSEQDTEITLGTGKLLGFFFLLVILCGVFFFLGYSFGRNIASAATKSAPVAAALAPAPSSSVSLPAVANNPHPDCARDPEACAPVPAANAAASSPSAGDAPPAVPSSNRKAAVPDPPRLALPPTASALLATGYVVQVAAISKQQDAEALGAALRRKQYRVFIAKPDDNLFHVQVGPFGERKDADAVRLRLIADGYTPIVK